MLGTPSNALSSSSDSNDPTKPCSLGLYALASYYKSSVGSIDASQRLTTRHNVARIPFRGGFKLGCCVKMMNLWCVIELIRF